MNGIIYNFIKNCGVFIIFLVDLEESFCFIFRVFFFGYFYFVFDFLGYLYWDTWKNWFFYFYRYYYLYGWSRYRFVRGWLKVQDQMMSFMENFSVFSVVGVLLIGKKVLVRRIDDGYFYIGIV